MKKTIRKALKSIGKMYTNKNEETLAKVSTLREMKAITINVFESLLYFVAGSKLQSKWTLISKLIQPKSVACEVDHEVDTNELEKVDVEMISLNEKVNKFDFNTFVESA